MGDATLDILVMNVSSTWSANNAEPSPAYRSSLGNISLPPNFMLNIPPVFTIRTPKLQRLKARRHNYMQEAQSQRLNETVCHLILVPAKVFETHVTHSPQNRLPLLYPPKLLIVVVRGGTGKTS